MAYIASTGMGWYTQVCGVVKCMKESLLLSVNGAIMSEDLVERLADKLKQRNTNVIESEGSARSEDLGNLTCKHFNKK